MATILKRCQSLVESNLPAGFTPDQLKSLMPNPVIGDDGEIVKEAGSILNENVIQEINDLSYKFMEYPDDVESLGLKCYRPFVKKKSSR
jgi:hypothetical protein